MKYVLNLKDKAGCIRTGEEDEEKFYVWGTGAVNSPLQCLFEKYAAENSSAAANYTLNNKKLDFSNADDWAVEINCPEGELDEASRFDDAVAGYESIPPGKRKAERTKEIFKRLEYSDTDWSLAADLFVRWNVEKDFLTESFEDFVDWIEEEELEGTVWTFFFGYQNEFRSFAEDWVDAAEVEEYLEFCRKAGYGDEDDDWLEIE